MNQFGMNYRRTAAFTASHWLDTSATVKAAGTYTLLVKADGYNVNCTGGSNTDTGNITEVSETNNVASTSVQLH